jgi:hypothetical protein
VLPLSGTAPSLSGTGHHLPPLTRSGGPHPRVTTFAGSPLSAHRSGGPHCGCLGCGPPSIGLARSHLRYGITLPHGGRQPPPATGVKPALGLSPGRTWRFGYCAGHIHAGQKQNGRLRIHPARGLAGPARSARSQAPAR